MSVPRLWQQAAGERHAKLGELVLRRHLILQEAADLGRQIRAVRAELVSIERTSALGAQLQAECVPTQPNGVDAPEH
jgi:hypothetical protein